MRVKRPTGWYAAKVTVLLLQRVVLTATAGDTVLAQTGSRT